MKKVLALILALVMVFALAACGGNGGSNAPAGGKTKVTLWATGSDNVRQIFETLTADFNSKNDQYEVELQFMLSAPAPRPSPIC